MTPFPMEIKMLFRKSYSTGRGNWVSEGILISQMRKQEVRRGRHLLKVIQWIRFRAQETKRDLTLERILKECKRTEKYTFRWRLSWWHKFFSTPWAPGVKKGRVSCDGQLVVLPRISSPRRIPQPLPASQRVLTWQTQFPGLFSRCLYCQMIYNRLQKWVGLFVIICKSMEFEVLAKKN